MKFAIAPEIFDAFPGMRIITVLARGVDNGASYPALQVEWERAWTRAAEARTYGNSQSHPRVKPWREAFQQIGFSGKKFPSSIEALLRRALKGGAPPTISPLVDFYNMVSLTHIAPAGGFDVAGLNDDLKLRLTREGDTFQALDDDAAAPVPAGEVAYVTGSTVLTRHFVWRQAQQALITKNTRDVLLVSEILADVPDDVILSVESDLLQGLETLFHVAGEASRLDATTLVAAW
jgi:DNA/RNA-binding domain of Phe-tRNA-synthetase-like protein